MRREEQRKDKELQEKVLLERQKTLIDTRLKLVEMGKDSTLAEAIFRGLIND
jgi:hypothetical protein